MDRIDFKGHLARYLSPVIAGLAKMHHYVAQSFQATGNKNT